MDIKQLVCLDDFEARAKQLLPIQVWSYFSAGADNEETLRENRMAYRRYWFKPRILRDVSVIDISCTLLGERIAMPICIAPTALQGLAHTEGDMATCRAAADSNTVMALSASSSQYLERATSTRPSASIWQTVCLWIPRHVTKDLVQQAEKAGCKAIILTLDVATAGFRRSILRLGVPKTTGTLQEESESMADKARKGTAFVAKVDDGSTWKDIEWIKTVTKLPIVLKGILTVEDAILAAEHGVQGIVVSNHGGRQLDCVPATIDVLSDIVDAVGDKLEVYVDGGIRTGTDVLKALALGARAVFIGRPVLYGLACNGEEGVKSVLQILRDEFRRAMALTGCSKLSDVTKDLITVSQSNGPKL
ncbi:2-Hydroxyacid oxidase 1-like [Ptychodera flava]|uniref:2-Hydroxyacid oxidase 1-like n=1 Tax=Ptychodera flava TaxID=63121 RepID=UPI003969D5BD